MFLNLFSLSALVKTDIELNAIAPAAIIGFSRGPPKMYNNPAAIGIPAVLYAKAQNKFSFIFLIVFYLAELQ